MMDRSIEMILSILAVLKAGSSYLPIDPQYPPDRIRYILADSQAKLLLTDGTSTPFTDLNIQTLTVKGDPVTKQANTADQSPTTRPNKQSGTSPAYVIYTSGSTGKPKGVILEHNSAVNLLSNLHDTYPFRTNDVYLLKTAIVFDVSVTECFGWFYGGGRLAILDPGHEKDPEKIVNAIKRHDVTHINFVPSMFSGFLHILQETDIHTLSSLRYIFLAGEALLPPLVEGFNRLTSGIALENLYGPTEACVYASRFSLSRWVGGQSVPIGKPIANTQAIYINPPTCRFNLSACPDNCTSPVPAWLAGI